jgi:hypothetical protein
MKPTTCFWQVIWYKGQLSIMQKKKCQSCQSITSRRAEARIWTIESFCWPKPSDGHFNEYTVPYVNSGHKLSHNYRCVVCQRSQGCTVLWSNGFSTASLEIRHGAGGTLASFSCSRSTLCHSSWYSLNLSSLIQCDAMHYFFAEVEENTHTLRHRAAKCKGFDNCIFHDKFLLSLTRSRFDIEFNSITFHVGFYLDPALDPRPQNQDG